MKAPKRIVVGVDLAHGAIGAGSLLAIEHARSLSSRTGAHVTLYHSYHLDERWNARAGTYEPHLESGSEDELAPLNGAAALLRADGTAVDVVASNGPAAEGLIRQVLQESADLAIVGKRTGKATDGRRLGSVSQKLVRYCPAPVLVVKPEGRAIPGIIVAATDGSDVGARVVDASASMAERCGAVLHVIHAIQIDLEVQLEGAESIEAYVRERRAELDRQIRSQVEAAGFHGKLEIHAGVTCPSRAVLEAEERLAPDLIVMGTVSRTGLPGLAMGNTAERLIGSLDCSLLVIKAESFACPLEI